jgi:hypothetical protein
MASNYFKHAKAIYQDRSSKRVKAVANGSLSAAKIEDVIAAQKRADKAFLKLAAANGSAKKPIKKRQEKRISSMKKSSKKASTKKKKKKGSRKSTLAPKIGYFNRGLQIYRRTKAARQQHLKTYGRSLSNDALKMIIQDQIKANQALLKLAQRHSDLPHHELIQLLEKEIPRDP